MTRRLQAIVALAGLSLALLSIGHVHAGLETPQDTCAACCVHLNESVALSSPSSAQPFATVVASSPTTQCADPEDHDRRSAYGSRGPPQSMIVVAD